MTMVFELVGYTPYEGSKVYGVFSTREKALEYLREIERLGKQYYEYTEIDVWEVDDPNKL